MPCKHRSSLSEDRSVAEAHVGLRKEFGQLFAHLALPSGVMAPLASWVKLIRTFNTSLVQKPKLDKYCTVRLYLTDIAHLWEWIPNRLEPHLADVLPGRGGVGQ